MKEKGVRGWLIALLMAAIFISAQSSIFVFAAEGSSDWSLTILHTNDSHARMTPFPRIATLVEGIRSEVPNVLLLDAGDAFLGDPVANFFDGKPMVEIMNAMDYNVMALGNHEFDHGQGVLYERSEEAEFPLLAANLRWRDYPDVIPPYAEDYVIIETSGMDVAVLGLITEDLPVVAHPVHVENLTVLDPIETADEYVPMLNGAADLVVVLSHLGYEVDLELAEEVEGIDVIVGGHSHTKLEEPVVVDSTIIVQAWEYGKVLGRLDLEIEDGNIVAFSGELISITPDIAEDLEIKAIVDYYGELLEELFAEVVGETLVPLDGSRAPGPYIPYMPVPVGIRCKETNLGNLVTDAILWNLEEFGAEIAFQNGGGIRWHRVFPAGPITLGNVYELLPFTNVMIVMDLTGEQILEALELSVSSYPKEFGGFLHVSGLRFIFDPAKDPFERVVAVWVDDEPLELDRSYRVALNDFLAAGGDGYAVFTMGENIAYTGVLYVEPLLAYLREFSPVSPIIEGRIVAIPLATIDIDPDVLNFRSKGMWITAYIELPEPYDVEDIVVNTVRLWYNKLIQPAWGKVQDGVLMVKFDRKEIMDLLLNSVTGEVELTIIGIINEQWFTGTDTILVISRLRLVALSRVEVHPQSGIILR